VKVTVPVGWPLAPAEVSSTVAVHVLGALTGTEIGEQLTEVELVRLVAVRLALPLLPKWSVSAP
jgi:hypothetical protein